VAADFMAATMGVLGKPGQPFNGSAAGARREGPALLRKQFGHAPPAHAGAKFEVAVDAGIGAGLAVDDLADRFVVRVAIAHQKLGTFSALF